MMHGFDGDDGGFAPLTGAIQQAADDAGTENALLLRIGDEAEAIAGEGDGVGFGFWGKRRVLWLDPKLNGWAGDAPRPWAGNYASLASKRTGRILGVSPELNGWHGRVVLVLLKRLEGGFRGSGGPGCDLAEAAEGAEAGADHRTRLLRAWDSRVRRCRAPVRGRIDRKS